MRRTEFITTSSLQQIAGHVQLCPHVFRPQCGVCPPPL